jgi:hypothetical protein
VHPPRMGPLRTAHTPPPPPARVRQPPGARAPQPPEAGYAPAAQLVQARTGVLEPADTQLPSTAPLRAELMTTSPDPEAQSAPASRVFAERGRRGYVERGYSYHGHDFARRSYFYHGHEYNRFYRGYGYHGMMLNVYAPGFYFSRGFYGWAYNPWAAPITFGWGWAGNPWFGFYGGYFQPYPVYPSAAFWLTDYIVSQDLQAAYAAHQEAQEEAGAPPPAGGQPVLTPEVKQMIADEVKAQLALENQEATQNAANQDIDPGSSGIARLLSDGRPHVFVAGGNLDVTDASGQECVVSDGDTLQMREAPAADATSANLVVLSSKGNPECQISLTVQVQLTDLQEMQNHMRETIDQGLQDLQDKQGSGGCPRFRRPRRPRRCNRSMPLPRLRRIPTWERTSRPRTSRPRSLKKTWPPRLLRIAVEQHRPQAPPMQLRPLPLVLLHLSSWARPLTRLKRPSARPPGSPIWDPRSSTTTTA